jgi:ABC-type branched-subunit amino acid transport system substrate-binding protein
MTRPSTHGRRLQLRLAAGVALVALVAAACSSSSKSKSGGSTATTGGGSSSTSAPAGPNTASAPGVTATQVTIGSHQPLTGVAAPGYDEIAPAANAYFSWVNDHGGVHGRKIVFKYLDDGYNPAETVSDVRQLVLQDNVFGIFDGLGTPTHSAVLDYLNSNKVPDLFVASGCVCWNQPVKYPYTFGFQTDYVVEGEIQGQYIAKNFAGQKIGYFVQNDDFGQGGVKGLDTQIPSSSIVSRQTYAVTNINVAPQIGALQAAGAQVVVLYTVPAFTALALLTAAKIGFHPTWVVSNVGADPKTLAGLLQAYSKGAAGASLAEGIISDYYAVPAGDPSSPWNQLWQQVHDKYIPNLPFDGNVVYGMESAYTFVQALAGAGQNPTRDSIVKAVEANKFSGPGLVPFSYSNTNHQGYSGVQMGKIQNGVLVLTGTPYTATDSGNIQPYTTPPPAPPANGIPPGV